jgi:FkbM family methyltransferase
MLIPFSDIVKRYGIKLNGILHVGAHTGEENDAYLAEGVPQRDIYWIEAIPELVTKLAQRVPNVIQAVVSDTVGPVTFNITNFLASSSILDLKDHLYEHPGIDTVKKIQTTSTTLDTIVDTYGIRANFLNMDIQGAELKCLKGFERNIDMVDVVYTEVNIKELYAGCALLHELDDWLNRHGFERKETSITSHGWGDAVYIRRRPYIHLHSRGRGGNQLFQIAASTILANELQADLKVNFAEYSWYFGDVFAYSIPYGGKTTAFEPLNCQTLTDDMRSRIQTTLQTNGRYAFGAWFENWTYLKPHLDMIKQLFQFKVPPVLKPEVIVHVRLGDVQEKLMSIPEYPERVAEDIEDTDMPIVIMSDSLDHPYTRRCLDILQATFPSRSVSIAPRNTEAADFLRMVQCQHLVGTNSTFVFWAGLLGSLSLPDKKTTVYISDRMVAPDRTKSLYRDDAPTFCKIVDLE